MRLVVNRDEVASFHRRLREELATGAHQVTVRLFMSWSDAQKILTARDDADLELVWTNFDFSNPREEETSSVDRIVTIRPASKCSLEYLALFDGPGVEVRVGEDLNLDIAPGGTTMEFVATPDGVGLQLHRTVPVADIARTGFPFFNYARSRSLPYADVLTVADIHAGRTGVPRAAITRACDRLTGGQVDEVLALVELVRGPPEPLMRSRD